MRIGSRQTEIGGGQQQLVQARATPEAFGAGTALALRTLGGALSQVGQLGVDLQMTEIDRRNKMREAQINIGLTRFEGEQRRRLQDSRASQEAGALGYTDQVHEQLQSSFGEFAKQYGLSPEETARYGQRFETFKETAVTAAYAFEFEQTNIKLLDEIGKTRDEVREELRINPLAFEDRRDELFAIIDNSGLPPMLREQLKADTFSALAETAFIADTQQTLKDMKPAQPPAADDVVAPGASAAQRGFASAIASVESGGHSDPYRVMYGGGSFESFADHPRQFHTITSGPNKGKKSSAAGKYQFLSSTWDFVKRSMEAEGYDFGPEAFSPVNQDRAFWWYANHRYAAAAKAAGLPEGMRNLTSVLESGDKDAYASARWILSGESGHGVVWEGLQHLTNEQFYDRVQRGAARGALGSASAPDVWNDPRYQGLSFEQKQAMYTAGARMEEEDRKARNEQRKVQEETLMSQLRIMIAQGKGEEAFVLGRQAIASGDIWSSANIEWIESAGKEYRENYETSIAQQERRQAGVVASGTDAKALNTEARLSGLTAGIGERKPEAGALLMENFRRDGMVPSDVMDLLQSQMRSADPAQQLYALELMADMYGVNPRAATAGMTDAQARDVALASTLGRFSGGAQEFLQRFNQMTDPANAQVRNERMKAADEMVAKLGPDKMVKEMYGFMERTFGGIKLPAVGDMPLFEQDMRNLFRENYAILGDEALAKEATAKMLRHSYTPSPFDGRLQQWSPSAPIMGVPTFNDSHDWIVPHVERAAQEYAADFRAALAAQGASPEAINDFVGSRFEFNNLGVVADSATFEDVQQGRPPAYMITYTDEFGRPQVLLDEQMQPVRVPIAPSEELVRAQEANNLIRHQQLRQSEIDREIAALREQQRTAPQDLALQEAFSPGSTVSAPELESRLQALEAANDERKTDQIRETLSEMSYMELVAYRNLLAPEASNQSYDTGVRRQPDETTERTLRIIQELLRSAADD